jgi:hypothetical protein
MINIDFLRIKFQLLSLINILYRFPKDKVPASSLPIPSLFTELDHHLFDSPVGENHVVQLIKSIIKSYCKVKFYHLGKKTTENSSG